MPHSPIRRTVAATSCALVLILAVAACASSDDPTAATTDDTTAAAAEPVTAAPYGDEATSEPVPSAGCGTSDVGSVVDQKEFLDDSDRWYLLTTPVDHDGDTPLPLVVNYHGLAAGAEVHALMTDMSAFGLENGFVVATPQGTGQPVRWDAAVDAETNLDLQYSLDVVDQLGAELCLDTSRVYATGLSNGAFISSTIGCTLADTFTAVAPVAGVMFTGDCAPERPMPIMGMHGTADPILYFNGGVSDSLTSLVGGDGPGEVDVRNDELPPADLDGEGFPAAAQRWADANGCEPEPTDEPVTDTVTRRVWDCPDDGAVEFWIVTDGGHSWPGNEFSETMANAVGDTDMSIDTNEVIWEFFSRFATPSA